MYLKFKVSFITVFLLLVFASCKNSFKNENLYGTWKYIKVESLTDASQSLASAEVKDASPSITFTQQGKLIIMWDGKKLSEGQFKVDRNIIRYVERLPSGVTRPIPFLIKKLTKNELVFQNMEQDATLITAVRTP